MQSEGKGEKRRGGRRRKGKKKKKEGGDDHCCWCLVLLLDCDDDGDRVGGVAGEALAQVDKARLNYESHSLSSACEAVLDIGNAGNSYIDERAPWSLFKQGSASAEAGKKDLVIILEAVRIIAIALSPVTPSLCLRIYAQLGYSDDQFEAVTWADTKWGGLKAGQVMAEPKPIFTKIELKREVEDSSVLAQKTREDGKQMAQIQGVAEA